MGECKDFVEYFEKSYAKRHEQWAHCYRQGTGLTTNNHIESMHNELKAVYLRRKQCQRLDKLLHTLLEFTNDRLIKQLISHVRPMASHRTADCYKKHCTGVELAQSGASESLDGWWLVQSQSLQEFKHTVVKGSIP